MIHKDPMTDLPEEVKTLRDDLLSFMGVTGQMSKDVITDTLRKCYELGRSAYDDEIVKLRADNTILADRVEKLANMYLEE
jgi:hypothetical protein